MLLHLEIASLTWKPFPIKGSKLFKASYFTGDHKQLGIKMKDFFASLFDLKFEHFITRKISGVFYAICLAAIGLFSIFALGAGLYGGFQMIGTGYSYLIPQGLIAILVTLIVVPVSAFIGVILTRLIFEASVALVAVAENTKK